MESLSEKELLSYSISTLAWVGDAVFELLIRSRLAKRFLSPSGKLHRIATSFVSAKGQAILLDALDDDQSELTLSEQESNLLRRARNFHCHSMPRDIDLHDYRRATAFEALIGWLWLNGQRERVDELVNYALRQSSIAEAIDLYPENLDNYRE